MNFSFKKPSFAKKKFTISIMVMIVIALLSTASFAADKNDLLNAAQRNKFEDVKEFLKEGLDFKETYVELYKFDEFPSYELCELLLNNGLDPNNLIDQVLSTFSKYRYKTPDDDGNDKLLEQKINLVELALKHDGSASRLLKMAITQYVPDLPVYYIKTISIPKQEKLIKLALDYEADFSTISNNGLGVVGGTLPSFAASKIMLENSFNSTVFLKMVLLADCLTLNEEYIYEISTKLTAKQNNLIKLALKYKADPKQIRAFYIAPSVEISQLFLKEGLDRNEFLNLVKYRTYQHTAPGSESRQKELIDFLLKKEGADLNQAKDQYPELDDLFTFASLDQDTLRNQLTQLLNISLAVTDKNHTELQERFAKSAGSCMGLTSVWLNSKWLQYVHPEKTFGYNYDRFKKTKISINYSQWKNAKNSTEEIINSWEFASLIDFLQQPHYQIKAGQLDLESVLNSGKLDTYGKTLKRKYSITSVFTSEQLSNLLKEMVYDDEWIYILLNGVKHAAGLFKHGSNYYFYDPNDSMGEFKSTSIEKIAEKIITNHKELATLGEEEKEEHDEHYFIDDEELTLFSENTDAISFVVIGDSDKKTHTYPDQKTFLTNIRSSLNEDALLVGAIAAIDIGCIESLKFFLEQGDNLNSKRYKLIYPYLLIIYDAALNQLTENNCADIVEELLSRMDPNTTVNINIKTKTPEKYKSMLAFYNGKTALHLASQVGNINVASAILNDKRTNINQASVTDEKSALMYAAEEGYTKIVKLLLGKGADKDQKDKDGKTAFMLAQESGVMNEELEKLLKPENTPHHQEL